jgi:hypothetical protein
MIDQGVRQFLDLGSGIPTVGNVHQVAQAAAPESRVVYVDYEEVAVAHSELLLDGIDSAAVIGADITQPDAVLNAAEVRRLLDFDQPLGLLAVTVGHYIPPEKDPVGVFGRYRDAIAVGSYFALTHLTDDFASVQGDDIIETMKRTQDNVFPRTIHPDTSTDGRHTTRSAVATSTSSRPRESSHPNLAHSVRTTHPAPVPPRAAANRPQVPAPRADRQSPPPAPAVPTSPPPHAAAADPTPLSRLPPPCQVPTSITPRDQRPAVMHGPAQRRRYSQQASLGIGSDLDVQSGTTPFAGVVVLVTSTVAGRDIRSVNQDEPTANGLLEVWNVRA